MGETVCDTTETMLASVQEEVDDPELAFKLRTARQLNLVCKEELDTLQQTLDEVDLEDETIENLRELGYLE